MLSYDAMGMVLPTESTNNLLNENSVAVLLCWKQQQTSVCFVRAFALAYLAILSRRHFPTSPYKTKLFHVWLVRIPSLKAEPILGRRRVAFIWDCNMCQKIWWLLTLDRWWRRVNPIATEGKESLWQSWKFDLKAEALFQGWGEEWYYLESLWYQRIGWDTEEKSDII